jgi:hypothetical protein
VLTQVEDPFCRTLTTQQNLQSRCTFRAITYNGDLLFVNSEQGKPGSMSSVISWRGPGLFSLDLNILRRFVVAEGISAEVRLDAISATNTPNFNNPNLNINGTTFGRISAPSAAGANAFTSPTPYAGNRVFVANLRVSF